MAPDSSACAASGPALNVLASSVTSAPRALLKNSLLMPTIGVAWVRLGKYPRRRVTFPVPLDAELLAHPAPPVSASAPATATPTTDRREIIDSPSIVSLLEQ